jgi:2'-5' RNA ligase
MPGPPARSALVVAVPEGEPVVGDLRQRLDANAALGVPAHVTVLFPFVRADRLDADVRVRLAGTVAPVEPFRYRFSRTAWFDEHVLYLAPDDPQPFRELTQRVWDAFPAHPPFEGAFADVVPHLTVGHDQPPDVLRAAEREVAGRLPVEGTATEVLLLVEDGAGRWRPADRFALSRR